MFRDPQVEAFGLGEDEFGGAVGDAAGGVVCLAKKATGGHEAGIMTANCSNICTQVARFAKSVFIQLWKGLRAGGRGRIRIRTWER